MKTAEDVAASIIEEIKQYFDTYRLPRDEQNDYKLSAQKCIEHHLTAYAEERVKEDRDRIIYEESDRHLACAHHIKSLQEKLRNARAEAFEEAAKLADDEYECDALALQIRALKEAK